jgi:hypothetical protein
MTATKPDSARLPAEWCGAGAGAMSRFVAEITEDLPNAAGCGPNTST